MKNIDYTLINITIIIMPLMIYLLYSAYNKTVNQKEDKLIFEITILTQIYLIFKYGIPIYKEMPLLIIDIPLILSYNKKSNKMIIAVSIINIIYYYIYYENYLIFIIIEYLTYFFISLKNDKTEKFTTIFWLIKMIFTVTWNGINLEVITSIFIFYIFSLFVIYILDKAEDMLKLNMKIKDIKHDEQITTSLFKITHEIKNPIAVCKGYLDMYDENKIDDFKRFVPIIKEEIDRTLILLEDFQAMNKLKINKEIVDINLLLEEVLDNMGLLFKKENIQLESKIKDDEIYINADYNRLTQVFINIFKNSIEALGNKKNPKIKVWTELKENNINIYINDNGEGISKETMKKIYEPFYTTKLKGTGLGVSLSNEIINAHEGRLEYESEENKYTLVKVSLPLEKAI